MKRSTLLRSGAGPRGFTLVELLVVIAIIGILVALLLPAVQAARQAAQRSSCSNNLKQLGLGLQNHHDQKQMFPPGGACDQTTNGWGTVVNGQAWGSSWLVYILPYIEQGTVYNNMNRNGGSGWGTNANANCTVVNNMKIATFLCPSAPFPNPWCRSPHLGGGKIMATTYPGISGADPQIFVNATSPYVETRFTNAGGNGGRYGAGGVLFANSTIGFKDMTDGSSNTMAIGEEGAWLFTQNGTRRDWRSNAFHGWIIGCHSGNDAQPDPYNGNYGAGGDNRSFSLTTVRYLINQVRGWPDHPGSPTVGVMENSPTNSPLRSNHPGGCQIALADGSNRFVSQQAALIVLASMATRDDGLSFELP